MKFKLVHPIIFPVTALCSLLIGCSSDKKVDFMLNELEFASVDGKTPFEQIDSTAIYDIYTGDTVVFKDISTPAKDERPRFWNLDGQQGWDAQDVRLATYVYETVGNFKVVLCIDDAENCVAKAILVKERPYVPPVVLPKPDPTPTPNPPPTPKPVVVRKPELKFLLPNVYSTNTNDSEFPIRASVRNISKKSDILLEVNGQAYNSFSLSKGYLTAKVPLNPGKNSVKLTATNEGGVDSQEIEFISSPGKPDTPTIGFVQPAGNSTITKDKYEVVVAMVNVSKKEQITLSVGSQVIKDFDFSSKTGELTATVPLAVGKNIIRVSASTPGGKVSQEVVLTYNKAALSTGTVGAPTADYPSSKDCIDRIKGSVSFTLSPSSDVDLLSFRVFTDLCGGAKVEMTGPGMKSHFQTALNAGRTQISMADVDSHLEAGNKYTLTLTPIAGYGNCPSSQTPSFNDVQNCSDVSANSSAVLKLDQKGRIVLFDLKFSY